MCNRYIFVVVWWTHSPHMDTYLHWMLQLRESREQGSLDWHVSGTAPQLWSGPSQGRTASCCWKVNVLQLTAGCSLPAVPVHLMREELVSLHIFTSLKSPQLCNNKHLIFHGIFLFSVTVELTVTKKFGIKWPELCSSHAWCLFYNKETFGTKSQFTTQHFPKPSLTFPLLCKS